MSNYQYILIFIELTKCLLSQTLMPLRIWLPVIFKQRLPCWHGSHQEQTSAGISSALSRLMAWSRWVNCTNKWLNIKHDDLQQFIWALKLKPDHFSGLQWLLHTLSNASVLIVACSWFSSLGSGGCPKPHSNVLQHVSADCLHRIHSQTAGHRWAKEKQNHFYSLHHQWANICILQLHYMIMDS